MKSNIKVFRKEFSTRDRYLVKNNSDYGRKRGNKT